MRVVGACPSYLSTKSLLQIGGADPDRRKAIQYWSKAGERALQRSANAEAAGHLTSGWRPQGALSLAYGHKHGQPRDWR